MIEFAYYNGVLTPYNATCIPLSDRSVFFSDAVYDVVIGYGEKVYQLNAHLDRLLHNAERIGLSPLPTKEELSEGINMLLSEAKGNDWFMLYIQLSGNGERRNHERKEREINTLITVTECNPPEELQEIKAITLQDIRHSICNVKTTNLLPAVLSVEEAKRLGADIAIFHKNGVVTECSSANVSLLVNGTVVTHPLDGEILPGITQNNLLLACRALNIPHTCRTFTISELYEADAVMITSTTKLIKICTMIDTNQLKCSGYDTVAKLFYELKRDLYAETSGNITK